ncbi:MBL fold metallo-hydrolase [Pseudoalteromonas sp. Of7M-16]|uniref:MBL fold metallo-hydrolase n=1 Tax=Pseudoalteromonas sp. Of7M-16 TaxID=2917756 RepID=UPI001EF59423|nr:MBL fold metallo-hydrolase [Pseudoalteromonas sp. Of7M-16]MCG7551728.1 MBL fold metallo-hydrolase [Pseudoalteromonas sp. Of7M-16]
MKKHVVWCLLAISILFSHFSYSQSALLPTLTKVRDHVYNLDIGYETNVGIVTGEKYVVLIESGFGKSTNNKIIEAVRSLTDKPIKYVVNLHMHGDHTGGNNFFASIGATIINQENVIYSEEYDTKYPTSSRLHFKNKMALELGNETIYLEHINSHTFDDGIIYLKKGNVLFIGENIRPQHLVNPGVLGMKSFKIWGEKVFANIDSDTAIVPAHGKAVINMQVLTEYRKNYVAWFNRFAQLYREGKSKEQMFADKTARKIAKKLNLDNNPKHFDYYDYYSTTLIDGDIDVPVALSVSQLEEYLGRYTANGKPDIIVELSDGQLLIKQLGSIISWIKPYQGDGFKVMKYRGGTVVFERDKHGQVVAIKTHPDERARNKEKYEGVFAKLP